MFKKYIMDIVSDSRNSETKDEMTVYYQTSGHCKLLTMSVLYILNILCILTTNVLTF